MSSGLWHRGWQRKFPYECREIKLDGFRADIKTYKGTVIEFQTGLPKAGDVLLRESVGDLVWVINYTNSICNILFRISEDGREVIFQSKHKTLDKVNKPLFLDVGNDHLIWVRKVISSNSTKFSWCHGTIISHEEFFNYYMYGINSTRTKTTYGNVVMSYLYESIYKYDLNTIYHFVEIISVSKKHKRSKIKLDLTNNILTVKWPSGRLSKIDVGDTKFFGVLQ